jgi:hypothetical protein
MLSALAVVAVAAVGVEIAPLQPHDQEVQGVQEENLLVVGFQLPKLVQL